MPTVIDVLKGLFPGSQWLPELDPETEAAQQALPLEALYTLLVRATASHPSACLANLGKHLWDVIHGRLSNVAMHSEVPTVSLMIVRSGDDRTEQSLVLLPPTWIEMFEAAPLMQWGAVVMTGSQVVDHFNGRFKCDSSEQIIERGLAYEAELLKTADGARLNDYQRDVLKSYPAGFDPKHAYSYRDVSASAS